MAEVADTEGDELRVALRHHTATAFILRDTGPEVPDLRTCSRRSPLRPGRWPWIVVEPATAEYARMRHGSAGGRVLTIQPGGPGQPAGSLNPLEPRRDSREEPR